ncbi:MAG: SUMF1/EgtB/PvdO family nonheme iron enzyme, partial [Bacteroidetes bacterium]|nr:SUMF1/EgtB/PvdO family nonheme iron enzyme [Bacteroidota bacterium]
MRIRKQVYQGLFLATSLVSVGGLQANNIQVSNVSLTGRDVSAGSGNSANFVMVKFDLSWENSWRLSGGPANWDAAWVFVKYRAGASNPTFSGVSSSGTLVTVNSTANLRVGMPVSVSAGTGAFAANTVISSITNSTQFVVSATPTTALSGATITCERIWEHSWLHNSGHTAATGSALDVGLMNTGTSFNAATNPGMGAFIYRSASGNGNVNFTNIQLRWNYGAQGISDVTAVDVEVFALEMVYVPQGAFWVGDGTTANIYGNFRDAASNVPFPISSEAALTLGGTTAGNLGNNNTTGMAAGNLDDYSDTATRTLPAAFPKGFNAFYCMKYELSQRQWIEFFNSLTNTQKSNRDITSNTSSGKNTDNIRNRNNISWTSGDATLNGGTHGDVACNFLNGMDMMAYLDWSGLRPMSELEFEKACRGPQYPVRDGLPWGLFGASSPTRVDTVSNHGTSSEVNATSGAIVVYNTPANLSGPVRVGALATSTSTVSNSSASYYGIQDLAGNVNETVVSTGVAAGRNFTQAVHGNGSLHSAGWADISTWPGYNVSLTYNSSATGTGMRGGAWNSSINIIRVS